MRFNEEFVEFNRMSAWCLWAVYCEEYQNRKIKDLNEKIETPLQTRVNSE